jgi:hypothetical protein
MTVLTESNYLRDIIRWENDGARFSREAVTVASGQDLAMGAVIGKITKAIATSGTADAGNTGAATVTLVTQGLKSKLGTYVVECTVAGVFEVRDPDGAVLGQPVAGAFTSEQINLTITDGAPPAAAGDFWTIACSDGNGKVKEIDAQGVAVDGTSEAYGIIIADCDATSADTEAVAVVRDAVIVSANLVWPTAVPPFTTAAKVVALAKLAAKGIVARDEA